MSQYLSASLLLELGDNCIVFSILGLFFFTVKSHSKHIKELYLGFRDKSILRTDLEYLIYYLKWNVCKQQMRSTINSGAWWSIGRHFGCHRGIWGYVRWSSWSHHFESVPNTTMTWLTVTEYMCHKRPNICSFCRNHNPDCSSFMIYYRVCSKSNTTCY